MAGVYLLTFNLGLRLKTLQVFRVCFKVDDGSSDKKGAILSVAFQKQWLVVISAAKSLRLVFPSLFKQ